jgi:hypothetical protein
MGIGREFQEETKYTRGKIPAGYYGTEKVPEPFETCPAPRKHRCPPGAPPPLSVRGRSETRGPVPGRKNT